MKALLRLYPSTWRARYQAEVTDVLEQRGSRLFDAPDLVRGALDAHLHPAAIGDGATTPGGASMSLRRAGWAALLGGALWALAYLGVWSSAWLVRLMDLEGQGTALGVGQSWLLTLLVAPALLVFAEVAITRSLALRRPWRWIKWIPALVCSLGALLMTGKLFVNVIRPDRPILRDTSQPELWVVGMLVMVIGALAFDALLLATGAVRRRVAVLLLTGALLNAAFLSLIGAVHVMTALRYSTGIIVGGAVFGLGWMVLGVVLLRRASAASPSTPVAIVT
jgi:hypothetical protein